MTVKVRHTQKLDTCTFKKEDGTVPEVGEIVEVSEPLAVHLERRGWGERVSSEKPSVPEARRLKPENIKSEES